jgi:hypothetical protein
MGEDRCARAELAGAEVSTSVRLEHDRTTFTKVVTELTVDLPGTWAPGRNLLLSEDSRGYRDALTCLTGAERDEPRWSEWRAEPPEVTSKGARIRLVYQAYGWVDDHESSIDVGLWRVQAHAGREWTLELQAPFALWGAWWDEVTVDPGRPGAQRAEPAPRAGEGATALVWRPGKVEPQSATQAEGVPEELAVRISLRPPWQRDWAARSNHLLPIGLDVVGVLLWVSVVAALLLAAVRRYRQSRSGTPTATQRRTLDNLKRWAPTVVALQMCATTDDLVMETLEYQRLWPSFELRLVIVQVLALASVVLLLAFSGPQPRLRWVSAATAAVALTCTVWLVVLIPQVPAGETYRLLEAAIALQSVSSFCVAALLSLAFAAVGWRLAADGRLLPRSRRFPGRDREFRIRVAGPVVLVGTLAMAMCFALAEERDWQRAGWFLDPSVLEYGEGHREDFLWQAMWSVSYLQHQILAGHTYLLTGLAVLAVMRTWHAPDALSPLHDRADRLSILVFFTLVVALDVRNHFSNSLIEFLWIPVAMAALLGAASLLMRRSVLAEPLELSGRPLSSVAGPAARSTLLDRARSYRETHAELRRLDQGMFGDVPPERKALERHLHRLHNWDIGGAAGTAPDRLPARVSVVDAALALGPREGWWGNGVRGARFALVPGLLAAVLNVWAQWVRGEAWRTTLSELLGFPGLVCSFAVWTAAFTAAGFVLGALWRVLPGRRGAVKALPVAGAISLPAGLDELVGRFALEGASTIALPLTTMLFVLTLTAIALDLDTFAGERRYWQSRLGLLLSIYQMRYYSLQVAYLIGQIIAIITIWQFFAQPGGAPSGGETPPPSNGSSGG